ncbi:MAG: hypothetical protein ABFE08_10480 [Armatimonadia bacterium]
MIKAGFARANITPPPGSNSPGGHFPRAATHVHDELYATAMVIDNGEETVALVGLDALSVKHSTVQAARKLANKLCGIKPENIMVGASHTHCGGPTCDCLGSRPEKWYTDLVGKQIAAAVSEANRLKAPVTLSIGRGYEDTVAFNRRFMMKDGKETTHPGKGNPNIKHVAGPIDPEVGVIAVRAADTGVLVGCLVNYTLHGTLGVGGSGWSADWPYYMREAISGVYGQGVLTVFLNGACGDITQVDNQSTREREFGEEWGKHVGRIVGAEAIKVIEKMRVEGEPLSEVPVKAIVESIDIPMRPVTPEMVKAAKQYLKDHKGERSADYVNADDMLRLAEWQKTEPEVPTEIQGIRIGDLGLVSNPAEYFCCFGLDIKSKSPLPQTMVVELANGCIGYVPDEKALGPKGGGYEPRHACSSKLVPEAGKLIAKKSVQVLKKLA